MISDCHLTPTQRALMDILSDGKPHKREELYTCIGDDLSDISNVVAGHIARLRKVLRQKGHLVICEIAEGKTYYRLARRVSYD